LHQEKALSAPQLTKLKYHVDKKAAELQKATASNLYKSLPKVRRVKARDSIAYFELSSILSPELKSEKVFYQGETAYAAQDFEKSISYYITAFDEAKITKNNKILSQ